MGFLKGTRFPFSRVFGKKPCFYFPSALFLFMNVSAKVLLGVLLIAFGLGYYLPAWGNVSGLVSFSSTAPSIPFASAQAVFCPSSGCVDIPVSVVDASRSRVWVAMYSFTNDSLADALIRAHHRGVDVRVIVEKTQAGSQYSQHERLLSEGVPVVIDTNPSSMHHKFAVVDESILLNGSMNWTGNGVEKNNENMMVLNSVELNTAFANEFDSLWNEFLP